MGWDWMRWKAMNGVGLDEVEGNEWGRLDEVEGNEWGETG